MNDIVDARVREAVRASSDVTRGAIFEDLLLELLRFDPNETEFPLFTATGTLVGILHRSPEVPFGPASDRTPEEEAETARRLATIDGNTIEMEELFRRVNQRVPSAVP